MGSKMGRPSKKTDCDNLQRYIHMQNKSRSRALLEALVANHGNAIDLPPLEDDSEDDEETPRNEEPDWWPFMWFGDLVTAQGPRPDGPPTISLIQSIVARSFNVTKMDILSQRRTQNVVLPRQIAMYLAKNMTMRSYPEIGRRFGGRDHSTAIHSVHKISARCVSDPEFAGRINALKAEIGA
jgi:hypothetical protein